MAFVPAFKIYEANGSTSVVTIPYVQSLNDDDSPYDKVIIDGLRGVGAIVIPGSAKAWTLVINFIVLGDNYTELIANIDTIKTAIVMFTPYVLKIDTSENTTKDINVKRVGPIKINNPDDYRNGIAECSIEFMANCW
jgi:hypothetical protein